MKVALCYHCVPHLTVEDGQEELAVTRFSRTYNEFPPGYPHELILNTHDSPGRDIAAHQHIAKTLDCDLAVFMSARTFFKRAGWLERIVSVWQAVGGGVVGIMDSNEACPLTPNESPNPHLRTCLFACKPDVLLRAPEIRSTNDGFFFESKWLSRMSGEQIRIATWKACFCLDERASFNGFRNGDQSDILAHDRHSAAYDAATPEQKQMLERIANGEVIT